jgi:putative tricarboxylic transport membrane protein
MGVFGIAEILRNLENPEARNLVQARSAGCCRRARTCAARRPIVRGDRHRLDTGHPARQLARCSGRSHRMRWRRSWPTIRRASGRARSRVSAGPEAANNAGAQTAFIPLLTLGIPPNAVMALMVGAMTIHGLIPGPQVMIKHPTLFWGMIASMWIGNLMLLVINLPLIGLWVRLLKVPYRLMFTTILMFCSIGIYSINNNPYDVFFTAFFGLAGYALIKFGLEPAPMLLGFVLGRLMEEKLRQALALSEGSFMTFVERPVSAGLLLVALAVIVIAVLPMVNKSRERAFQE